MDFEIEQLVRAAVHSSVFVSPTAPGLTAAEVIEVGKRLGYEEGELNDAIRYAVKNKEVVQYLGKGYLEPTQNPFWCAFLPRDEPDFRSVKAFDFVRTQFQDIARKHGEDKAQMERSVLVERGVAAGLPARDVEATITVMILGGHATQNGAVVKLEPQWVRYPLASETLAQNPDHEPRQDETLRRVYPIVEDVIARRSDGRAASPEPLDAFTDALEQLGYGQFRLWWRQIVAELRGLNPSTSPVSATVLAAALVEGALTFLVRHARKVGAGPLKSRDFDGDPRTWKIDELVRSAATGGDAAVLDAGTRHRADELIRTRQRIHAGRMLTEHPGGPPDLRPDEARDGRRTAELVVRRILDWLQRYPPVP